MPRCRHAVSPCLTGTARNTARSPSAAPAASRPTAVRSARARRTSATAPEENSMSRSDVLVDADWVQARIDAGDPKTIIVEVDEDTSAYDKNHIKTAVRIDWKSDLQDPVRRDFVDQAGFEKLLSEKGIAGDDTVVLYGGNNNWFAAYAYWYFKLYGHQDVKLLDGGRKKWELDSRDLVAEVPKRARTEYRAKPQDTSIRAFRDDVLAAIDTLNLVDVRSPDEFSGKLLAPAHLPQEQSQRPGHVPSARNIPWSKSANDDGTFKSDEDLKALYEGAERGPVEGHHRLLPDR
ncbi:sulfurtransferase [Streptomyces olivoverticillatus]